MPRLRRRNFVTLFSVSFLCLTWQLAARGQCTNRLDDCGSWESAPSPQPSPSASPTPDRAWYGWQPLLVDGVILGAGVAQIAADKWDGIYWTYGAYCFGSPIVHAAHHRWGIAAASFGLHAFVPLAFLGLTVAPGEGHGIGSEEYRRGMLVAGLTIPPLVDAMFFSRENPAPRPPPNPYPSSNPYPQIVSFGASVGNGAVEGSVIGTF